MLRMLWSVFAAPRPSQLGQGLQSQANAILRRRQTAVHRIRDLLKLQFAEEPQPNRDGLIFGQLVKHQVNLLLAVARLQLLPNRCQ